MYGDDFAHPEAQKSYSVMDAIIEKMKDDPNLTIKYSSARNYVDGVKAHGS